MYEDPIVNKVRKIRENLDAKFNFEAKAIFDDIRKRQAALGSNLVRRKKKPFEKKTGMRNNDFGVLHPGR